MLPACYDFLNMTGMYYIHVICYPHIELIIFCMAIFRSELKFKYTYFGCQFFVALHLWHYFRINPRNLLCNTLTKCWIHRKFMRIKIYPWSTHTQYRTTILTHLMCEMFTNNLESLQNGHWCYDIKRNRVYVYVIPMAYKPVCNVHGIDI